LKFKALTTALIIGLLITTFPMFIKSSNAATDNWTLIQDGRGVKAYADLKEYVWNKNATTAPNGPYDKIGLHRLVKTGASLKGVVFMIPGLYGSGEKLASNPPTDNFTKTENMSQCTYWANRGFDVYTIDYRNHFIPVNVNKSQLSFTADWGMEQFISDIKEAVDKAKEVSGAQKVFMAGMSWGGILTQIYAAKYWQQDLRGLILLDPAPPKSTTAKNQILTNSYNLTSTVNTMKASGNWLWENPQASSAAPSPLNPGYVFLVQFAAQNPGAPAQYPNGTLVTTINPRTNKTWTNITEWFEYSWNIANSFNTYGGYSDITITMNLATQAERYYPVRIFLDYAAMLDWTVCPYVPYDYVAHVQEINVPVIAFRSGLNLAAYGNITNGIATTDFTWTVLPNYGHSDVFQGTYSARDVSEPTYQWMISHYPPLAAAATPTTLTVETGQTATFNVYATGTVSPYTYQWYQETNLLIGQTKPQISLPTTKNNENGQFTYYCKITDAENQTTNSNIVTLAVKAPQPTPTTTPTVNPTPTPIPTPLPTITPTITPTPNLTTPSPTQDNILLNLPTEVTLGIAVAVLAIIIVSALVLMTLRKKQKH
jgi:pimeloyl-ACP methyl ester carboxylesterase